jgi:hypothetical protein
MICRTCEKDLPLEDFPDRCVAKSTKHKQCKKCESVYNREWYQKNKVAHSVNTQKNTKRYRAIAIAYTKKVMKDGCEAPGCEEKSFSCLEFHHRDPSKKEMNISKLVGSGHSLERIVKEVEKCAVLCANCHRKFHAGEIMLTASELKPGD